MAENLKLILAAATSVLSRWAKLGTIVQSLISLTIVVLLAARAVNIL